MGYQQQGDRRNVPRDNRRPTSKPSKPKPPAVQQDTLRGWVGKDITVFLLDQSEIEAKLVGFDTYTLKVTNEEGVDILIYKNSIVAVRERSEDNEDF